MARVASAEDDQTFPSGTMTGSAGPAAGAANTGWHNGSGNHCSFTGWEGGYAAAGGPHNCTATLGTATKQARIMAVLASVAEPAGITGNEAATLAASLPSSAGGISLTGNESTGLGASSPASAGGVTATGNEAATLDGTTVSAVGSTITRTGTEAATLGASLGSSSGTVAGGPIGTEAAALAPSSGAAIGAVAVTGTVSASDGASAAASAGGVSLTGTEAASDTPSSVAATGTVFTPATLALGALAFREKANTTGTTGTLTTLAVYPAWVGGTTYQLVNAVRVTNAGNAYELEQGGTAAGTGGPTGTGANIVDGGCKWNFLAAGTGACDTAASGSLILASIGTGRDATSPNPPTDNKGNTYSLIGSKSFFAGFPPSSAATYTAGAAPVGGIGHTFSKPWAAGNDGGGDEVTIAAVEVVGGTHVQDHSAAEINPTANVVTSLPVTTTGPAVLVCFCWLNGTVQADGFLHTAIAGSGFVNQPLASGLMEIANGAGQVQMATITKSVAVAGTYTASITTAGGEGAIMHLIAVQGVQGITGTESAASGASIATSSGTVTTPRIGTGTPTLAPTTAAATGSISITGTGAAVGGDTRAAAAGTVAVTGTASIAAGASIAASAGTLIPVITGTAAAASGASLAASLGQVISGHAGDVGATLAGSLVAAAGTVRVTGAAATQAGDSSPGSVGGVLVTGVATAASGASQAASRAITPGNVVPRLAGSLATNGQLTGTLQLQGVTVADITGPITVYQGDTATYLLTVVDDTGAAFDLTTATAIDVRVKTAEGAADPPLILKSLGLGVDLLTARGKATITLGTADTSIPTGRYRIDVTVTAPALRQHVIAPRDFTIAPVV